ncbi:MAG: hypothetical protein J1F71_02645 [Clostridiales bacterium]|nr:hypothetical protein [Clostridiales bacterium]
MDKGTLIGVLFVFPIAWAMFSLPILYYIKAEGRKHYKKNKKVYPYLSYPFYKKIFLLGLRGAVNKITIVVTFAFNIITVIGMVLCIVLLIHFNIYVSYCLRAAAGAEILLALLKAFLHFTDMPKL